MLDIAYLNGGKYILKLRKLKEMENARRKLEKGQEKLVSQKMFKAI